MSSVLLSLGLSVASIGLAQADFTFEPDLETLADQLYQREAKGQENYLVHWNSGEQFASLGIGHFIWYPADVRPTFVETFPDLARFIDATEPMPAWLKALAQTSDFALPWATREAFEQAKSETKLKQLRQWLARTQQQQAQFVWHQFQRLWQVRLTRLSHSQQSVLNDTLQALSQNPKAVFALVDYSHFKGVGAYPAEQYQHQGWGLIEVLLDLAKQPKTLQHFKAAAKARLAQRVALSPPERNERRWLKGWFNRIDRY